jgi:hypothetical protein
VLKVEDYPDFDDEAGVLPVASAEDEVEIELSEVEPSFLKGGGC